VDLTSELRAVLDNPATVWDAVVTNLANEPRIALLVLTTCKTPISLVEWQEALSRVSIDAAVKFESSLRVLDDSFVKIQRAHNIYRAEFRNPSMDDFCAGYLDRNVGIATTVASRKPALQQIGRLIELGTAQKPVDVATYKGFRQRKFVNIYEALISDPSVLLERLLEIMPDDSRMSDSLSVPTSHVLTLLSQASHVPEKWQSAARARLSPTMLALDFNSGNDRFIYFALVDHARARALSRLLGSSFETLYARLAASAIALSHFDTLVNIDIALERSGSDAIWASRFEEFTPEWLEEEGSSDDHYSSRETYVKVAEHLQLEDAMRIDEWDDLIAAAEESEKRAEEEAGNDDEDDSWRSGSGKYSLKDLRDSLEKHAQSDTGRINAMFAMLNDPDR
jgi:hypothetical protein